MTIERGAVIAHAIDLVASHIYLDVVSVGATINIMMAAAWQRDRPSWRMLPRNPILLTLPTS